MTLPYEPIAAAMLVSIILISLCCEEIIIGTNFFVVLKSEYHASDPLHAYVYILYLRSVVSHEYTFITIASHINPAEFQQI